MDDGLRIQGFLILFLFLKSHNLFSVLGLELFFQLVVVLFSFLWKVIPLLFIILLNFQLFMWMLVRVSFQFSVVLLGYQFSIFYFLLSIQYSVIISVYIVLLFVLLLLLFIIYFFRLYLFPLFLIPFFHFNFISFGPFIFTSKVYRNLNLKVILVMIMEFNYLILLFNHMQLEGHY